MEAHRIALAFEEYDVDAFLDKIDYDQYADWQAYFQLEPHGWPALQMATTRLSFMTALSASNGRRRLKERQLELRTAASQVRSDAAERAIFEARSIQARRTKQVRSYPLKPRELPPPSPSE